MARTFLALLVLAGVVYGLWRLLIFVRILLRPAMQKYSGEISAVMATRDKFNDHVSESLHSAGLGKVADVGESVDGAVRKASSKLVESMDKKEILIRTEDHRKKSAKE